MTKETSVGAVIYREQKETQYLLLHYPSDHWDFVKGNVEEGESDKQTLIRETEEETGIKDLDIIDNFKEEIHYFYKREGKTISKNVVFLLAKTKTKDIRLSHEHVDFKWLSFKEALKKLTFDNAKEVLKKTNSFL